MSTETPTLLDVIELAIQIETAHQHHQIPGRVESYDAAKQEVVVTPMLKVVSRNADEERLVDTLPVLPAIPVEWPRGGGYFMCMPLEAGDEGTLFFTDHDLAAWRDSGAVSDPGDERRFALGGAVFRPGLCSIARVLTGAGTGHLVLGKEGGPAIHLDGSTVQLGAAGGFPVVVAATGPTGLETWITAVSSALGLTPPALLKATKAKAT